MNDEYVLNVLHNYTIFTNHEYEQEEYHIKLFCKQGESKPS